MLHNYLIHGNSLKVLEDIPDDSVQCVITSPPYWGLRNYQVEEQIGLEERLEDYIENIIQVFEEIYRILKSDGTVWLNIGDVYTSGNRKYRAADKKNGSRKLLTRPKTPEGLKPKDLIGIPWRVALKLQEIGWYLRNDIIWHKPNAMPESVKDRPYRNHEYLFLFSKNEQYFFNNNGLVVGSKKIRSVWEIPSNSWEGTHSATFPKELVIPCVKSSTKEGQLVLDPFFGSGTVGCVCEELSRNYLAIELNRNFIDEALDRIKGNMRITAGRSFISLQCR
ncbi:MAG: site-specific DNA-methyltransferase, partial [Pseudomonadota bacterium]|nr:site-specific DNA-methyltransferase [Pseudomonadota bacterium]